MSEKGAIGRARHRGVTMHQVAAAAGVSVATVSRVLSGSRPVQADIAVRVTEASVRLGYRPNRVARALRTRSTRTVGLVIPSTANPLCPELIQAVQRELHRLGLVLVLADCGDDPDVESELVDTFISHRLDGLLISPCHRFASRAAVDRAAGAMAVVQVDRYAAAGVHFVGAAQRKAIRSVIDHLAAQGRQRLALVVPQPTSSTTRDRIAAFAAYARTSDPGALDRICEGDVSLQWGYEATVKLLAADVPPDAIVCASDLAAVGCLSALADNHVPAGTIAVTGFDDTLLATAVRPRLTTVRQPVGRIARAAVSLLREAIEAPDRPVRRLTFGAEVIVRESSAPATQGVLVP